MEKFVLWFGNHSQQDFKPARDVLKRNQDEIEAFFQFDFASLITFSLPENNIQQIQRGNNTIIQIGELEPKDGWNNFEEISFPLELPH